MHHYPLTQGLKTTYHCYEVTLFQLEKIYGKGKQAQEFIAALCKGDLALFDWNRGACVIPLLRAKDQPVAISLVGVSPGHLRATPHATSTGLGQVFADCW